MSPEEHRDAAVQALADVDGCPESPGEARVLTQAAIAHALLALVELQMPKPPIEFNVPEKSVCGECGEPIYRYDSIDRLSRWMHVDTAMTRCYRDPDTETAYPDPDFATTTERKQPHGN